MIVLLATASHCGTHLPVTRWQSIDFRVVPYHRAFRSSRLPQATYIFSDPDRLGFWDLELAARLYRLLRRAGLRVLNDPAVVKQRYELLRALKDERINDFDAFLAEETTRPRRYPLFLRTRSAHRGVLSDLLHDAAAVETAVAEAVSQGIPQKELILVEYCAEPLREGLFRKLSVYRVGSVMVPSIAVHESRWQAKAGELGIADRAIYEEEFASVSTNRYGEAIRPAFELAHIEYGRADFGIVQDRPQVYEINTNPYIKQVKDHPFPVRVQSARLCMERMEHALAELDTSAGGRPVPIDDDVFVSERRRNKWTFGAQWVP